MEVLRNQIEGALLFAVANVVLWFAFASSNMYPLNIPVGRAVRWAALAELVLFALAYVVTARRELRVSRSTVAAAVFAAVALLSAAWSADASLSFGRALTFSALLIAGGAIASSTRARLIAPLLVSLLVAAAVIAALGVVKLIVDSGTAIVPATKGQGARYQGIGANPDTMALLFGVVMPLAVWAVYAARGRAQRIAAWATLLLLDASIAASGSRGALVAGVVGVLLLLFLLPLGARQRWMLVAATLAVFAVDVAAGVLPPHAKTEPALNIEFGQTPVFGPHDAAGQLPLSDEFGFPRPNHPRPKRSLFDAGGRRPAWEGAIGQAEQRPLLGYGFGMEDKVFVDRYYPFLGSRPENSYIGTLLQLGVVGLVLLLAFFALVLREAIPALRRLEREPRAAAVAALAVIAAGLVLAIAQSYVTSVGSPATTPLWICAFLLGAQATARLRPTPPE